MAGGASSELAGGSFRSGFLTAGFTSFAGPGINRAFPASPAARVVAAAVVGGTTSEIGGGKFANGAVSAAFAHLFSEMPAAANDDDYAMVPEEEWDYIMATSPRVVGAYDDPYYFDPREISPTGPTWENFVEYNKEVTPWLVGGFSGGVAAANALRVLGPAGRIIGHPAYGGRTINGLRSGQIRFGWSRDGGPTLRLRIRNKHIDFVKLKPPTQ